MADFKGRLTVINSQSSLNNDLLLRAGFPDATQAIFAATQFLLKTAGLIPGQPIIVTGNKGSFGGVSVIVMTNARADTAQPFMVASELAAAALPSSTATTKRRRSKKSGSAKSASPSTKSGSKRNASKKGRSARKRGAGKSSTKK